MRIVGYRGTRSHAPENSLYALASAYTAGADALHVSVQTTRDGQLVLAHDATMDRMTGVAGRILDLTLAELRTHDFSATFRPRGAANFRYYHASQHRLRVSTLQEALELLPTRWPKLIELRPEATLESGRRDEVVRQLVRLLSDFDQLEDAAVCSTDADALRLVRDLEPGLARVAHAPRLPADAQLAEARALEADGLFIALPHVMDDRLQFTALGLQVKRDFEEGRLRLGAVVHPDPSDELWTLDADLHAALSGDAFVWGATVDSALHLASVTGRCRPWIEASFAGRSIDTTTFAFGYAKANSYCHVFQHDGVRMRIRPYNDRPGPWPADSSAAARIAQLEEEMTYIAKDWPFYSGGGVGLVRAVRGDFVAEVDYEIAEPMTQAMTLEMAAVNVDPGAHQPPWNPDNTPRLPRSFRDKDSFYDPHGAPPYVGVEHDEEDGYRINWNLGIEYDNNQYGRPVGDGRTPRGGRLRLERRGPYFSAYYRNDVDAPDWVCVGVVRNDSLNQSLHLRCVAKRWRQERPGTTNEYMAIPANEFTFRNLTVARCRMERG